MRNLNYITRESANYIVEEIIDIATDSRLFEEDKKESIIQYLIGEGIITTDDKEVK